MKTTSKSVLNALLTAAPGIAFSVVWERDDRFKWDGDGPDPKKRGYWPHDVTVTAKCVIAGTLHEGNAYLGGSYIRPERPCPEIHGYWLQMACEAVEELPPCDDRSRAIDTLKAAMRAAYDEQRAQIALDRAKAATV